MSTAASKRIRQILAAGILGISAAIAGTVALKQFRSVPPDAPPRNSSPDIDMAMSRASFSEMRGNEKLWDLTAERAEYDKETGRVRLHLVRTEIHEGAAGGALLTSQTGLYDEPNRTVQMDGRVRIVTRRGMVLETDHLEYRPARGVVSTDRPVRVTDGRLTLTAVGMELILKDEQIRFRRQVHSVIEGYHVQR